MSTIDVMKQALEAVEKARFYDNDDYDYYTCVILNLEDAIEQIEKQEPVAWMFIDDTGMKWVEVLQRSSAYNIPLYTHPDPAVPEGEK